MARIEGVELVSNLGLESHQFEDTLDEVVSSNCVCHQESAYQHEHTTYNIYGPFHTYPIPLRLIDQWGYPTEDWPWSFSIVDDFGNSVGVEHGWYGDEEVPYWDYPYTKPVFPVIH